MKWPKWIIVILGVWLAFAPFPLGYASTKAAVSNGLVVGLAIAIVSIWHGRVEGSRAANWLNWKIVLLGIWVLLAPFVLSYHKVGLAGTNDIFVGAAVIILAWLQGAATAYGPRRHQEQVNKSHNVITAGRRITFRDWMARGATKPSMKSLSEDQSSVT